MKALAIACLVMLTCSEAICQYQPQFVRKKYGTAVATERYKVLSAVAASASATDRTFTLDVRTFSHLSVVVDFTKHTGTALVLTCSASLDLGTTYAQLTTTSTSSGAVTVSKRVDTLAVAGSDKGSFEYELGAWDYFKCLVDITGGDATDFIDAYATARKS